MKRILKHALAVASLFCVATGVQAQIPVTGPGAGSTNQPFNGLPPVSQWSSKSLPGAGGAPETIADMDLFVNGSTNAASTINTVLGSNATLPPATSAQGAWSSAGFYLQTRPTGNAVTLLMTTLTNLTGGAINSFSVDYEYQQRLTVTGLAQEFIPAHRVYYSLSGNAGSWVPLGNFGMSNPPNTAQPISIPIDVSSTPWAANTAMYILFGDDNSLLNNDWANGIDNFQINNVVTGGGTCVGITANPTNVTAPEHGAVSFSITATGTPQTIRWYHNGALIPGANASTYTFTNNANPANNGNTFRASVSNSLCNVTSTVATLTVLADVIRPTITSVVGTTNLNYVTITFSEAVDPITIDASLFTVFPPGTDPDVTGLGSYDFTNINSTTISLHTDPRTAGANYSLRVYGEGSGLGAVQDIAATPNLMLSTTNALIAQDVELFTFNKSWHYIDTGADLGTTWKDTSFADGAWPQGQGILAFENTLATLQFMTNINPPQATNTILLLTNNSSLGTNGSGVGTQGTNITFYFRTHVNMSDFNPNTAVITMRGIIDDGAILYVNGVEQFRYNMTNTGYLTLASANATEAILVVSNLVGFTQGDNVIAVEVHQNSVNSSDIVWGMELEARVASFGGVGPTLKISRNAATGAVTVSWTGSGTLQSATTLAIPGSGTVWTDVPGNPNPFTFTPAPGSAPKFFSLKP